MDFFSHLDPERILIKDHLISVGTRCRKVISTKKFDEIRKDVLEAAAYLIGISHDFGKYSIFFQKRLIGTITNKDQRAHHSLLSALFGFEVVKYYLTTHNLNDEEPYKYLPLLSFFIIKHHHGNMRDIEIDLNSDILFRSGFSCISEQLKDIWKNILQITNEYDNLLNDYKIPSSHIFSSLSKFKTSVNTPVNIESLIKELDRSLYFFKKSSSNIIYFLIVQLLYSVLIDSDKKHAGHVPEAGRQHLPEKLVEDYLRVKRVPANNINNIRNDIRKTVLKNITTPKNIDQRIFTLTAPTGTGKTLTSLSAALTLRKNLKKELGFQPRIIYSLPFTSIIDQTFDVFESVLEQLEEYPEKRSQYLLKHHYLADIYYQMNNDEQEVNVADSLALIESWESEINITTFIQLFYTLIGYRNRSLKKFHNIVNSIIILDEVQNIPIEYWNLVNLILNAIGKYFHCRIILMTATRPLILKENQCLELVDNYQNYFQQDELNRVLLNFDLKQKEITTFCNELQNFPHASYLFVFNTIDSSLQFYNKIKKKIENEVINAKIIYLSTNIIPKHRKDRISQIKRITKDISMNKGSYQKIIIISTQLIEAGVDIDCDCVYRDIGPLDSIIQVAGRCNREKRLDTGEVHLVNLIRENGKDFTTIYSPVLIHIVREILTRWKTPITEKDFLDIIQEYFEKAKAKSFEARKIINAIYELNYDDRRYQSVLKKKTPISSFKLIKEDYYRSDLFIEIDDDAKSVWEEYERISKERDLFKRKERFLKIKTTFYDYVISIPKKYIIGITPDDRGLVYGKISLNILSNYYDYETGFKREDTLGGGTMFF